MFSDSSDDEGERNVQLTINEHYAKAFNYRKEREELEKLKEKYGSDFEEEDLDESTDSESAESEDEDGEELTPAVDAAILRTLARIRKKDPAIYDSSKSIFGEEAQNVEQLNQTKKPKDKSKPVTVRQVALDAVLHGSRSPSPEPNLPTHVEEQRALRDETIAAFHSAVPEDDDVDDLLIPREKTKDEIEAEEEEYKAYLARQVGEDLQDLISLRGNSDDESTGKEKDQGGDDEKKDEKEGKKSKKKKKSKAEKDEEFLVNYILNRGWIDKDAKRVPTYKEVTESQKKKKGKAKEPSLEPSAAGASDEGSGNEEEDEDALLSDASFESLASHFESSYNHRFEEPGAATIQTFPRNIASVVRRTDSTRKEARERRKARKEEELAKKKEEVRRLKALRMKEIKRKLEKIGKVGGLLKGKKRSGDGEESGDEIHEALKELDLEGEWDPTKHDQQMEGLFANVEEGDEGEDEDVQYDADGKPIWKDDIDIGDIPMSDDDAVPVASSSKKDKKKKKKKKKDGEDEQDVGVDIDEMDADKVPEYDDDEEWDGTEEMRKRKWKEYMNELYELDFNDMVGGMPTRFKYVPVPAQTYSLDPVEILLADDADLNEYMSLKKYAPYRKDGKVDRSRWDPKQQEKLREFRRKIREREKQWGIGGSGGSGGFGGDGEDGGPQPKKKRKGKKERMKLKAAAGEGGGEEVKGEEGANAAEVKEEKPAPVEEGSKKKKRKREEKEKEAEAQSGGEDKDGGETQDGAPKKKKRRRRHGKKGGAEDEL
ncbi:hypothetical protein CC1G_04651 [Coprinopsis cinerea okayama7|uniref:Kri1-like C-terminal domain-containing protein n=1 Tax=Coprinopsis cinerea (strain Okayama-7 / 130 / ATCC MYA-4618 / FGSC 9003) TaxID=240176 RepID=A8N544_COPC7|nr:hypothetical protein CC1G_04651 [Coprinopsis cinerea okayama7\|eukprot:XP_001829962.1 hypothetical protein CC1G_04651 [Coprinopsis cinerea okayama7\